MSFKIKHHQMVPQAIIDLRKELTNHPELTKKCQEEARDFEESLAMIATYCGVIVDGVYDVSELCDLLVRRLQGKRIIVVNSLH